MTNQEIFELISHFDRSTVGMMKLTQGDFTLELQKGDMTAAAVPPVEAVASSPKQETEAPVITAPLVGTFYAAPAPDQPAFVSVGDRVPKGQTVCLIEAMKMMSEVPAPCDCVILDVRKPNGELAQFGEPLFSYRPC